MPILQLSVFAENKPGAMTAITRILGEAGVDIRALSLADTSDYGILRLIVDKPEQAQKALDSRGYILRISPVIGVAVPDEIAVAGFDDTPLCRMVWPELTSVRQDSGARARLAVQKLRELREGSEPGTTVRLPVTLIERASTRKA